MKKMAVKMRFPKNTGNVLDIGSGNNCLDIATHLVDLMPESNSERAGDLERMNKKEFRQGSLENIPYPDRYFDFVHAAHVLEHTMAPEKALSELKRVAYCGYIETPAPVMEQGCYFEPAAPGWSFHRWYVWSFPNKNKLYLKPKTQNNVKDYCTCYYGKAFSEMLAETNFASLDPLVPYYCKMTQFRWYEGIEFEIWGESEQGHGTGHSCDCFYAAFFAHLLIYFSSLRQIRRRYRFKKQYPRTYNIAKQTALITNNLL